MEKPVTPIEKIDTILNILQSQDRYKTRLEIENILSALEISINQDDIVRILDKLVNDGYVIEIKQDNNGIRITPQYLISWSGHLFDSYDAKASRDAEALEQQRIDAARLIQLESQNLINSGRLNRLTRWLAWGTIGLAVIELIKFLCDLDPCIKEFFEKIL